MSATAVVSGTAAILALCEAFTAIGRQHFGIDFVAYGAEEHGRHEGNLGDVEYVRRNPVEGSQTRLPPAWRTNAGFPGRLSSPADSLGTGYHTFLD